MIHLDHPLVVFKSQALHLPARINKVLQEMVAARHLLTCLVFEHANSCWTSGWTRYSFRSVRSSRTRLDFPYLYYALLSSVQRIRP